MAAVAPSVAPEPPLHTVSPSYNISLNLSSLITFPSRLLARIRKADDFLFQDALAAAPSLTSRRAAKSNQFSGRASDLAGPLFPGPYGFFLSGYMIGLVALAILMHRIQNIVVPPRTSSLSRHTSQDPFRRFYGYNAVRRIYSSVLPLDLSRTTTRIAFHLPSLYFLLKMFLIWTVILLQTSDLFPVWESGYIYSFGQWTQQLEMHDVCWWTFCAICAAFSMEAFVRGLDGGGLGFIQVNANTSPFNLIGYAFLLHIYSSPITHVYKPPSLPSRPDKHVVVTITIPLLQLTIFHILSIRKRWSHHRLFPTALASMLSLLHFHLTLYSHYYSPSQSPPPPLVPVQPKVVLPPPPATPGNFAAPTPPPVVTTLLILTIALTIALNALTQLILTGRVSRPLLGLGLSGSSTNGAWVWAPPYDEDWGVVLLRVGTASLEATGLRGWGNEMPFVSAAPVHSRPGAWADPQYPEYGTARLGPSGVVYVSSGFTTQAARRRRRRGLVNEVREVDVGAGGGSRAFGADLINLRWLKEAWRFVSVVWDVTKRLVGGVWGYIMSGGKSWGSGRQRIASEPGTVLDQADMPEEEDEEVVVYGRFLRQEEISDDDDDDPAQEWDLGSSDSEDEPEQEELSPSEAVGLYTDIGETAPAPVLLAHMTHDGESPLTRRRYGSLLGPGPRASEVPVRASPAPRALPQPVEEARRNCVICTVDAREIICWPCRCLSMCDACREVLASRSSSKHRCPCCRQTVEGYSRIFIP
ncbi:hypothetical protein B0H10DRAFT_2026224 [Mycena sp. CBHHK59/15]|nr:hypothetical protein B0H10DRAFT_2026224 [Mycena sp. CBHHK59/15]